MRNILVLGGAGYIGTELCNHLSKNFKVFCYDTFWFGNYLNKKVKKINGDIRKIDSKLFKNKDVVICLAYLSNDPSCEVDARQTWEIGPLSLNSILNLAVKNKIKKVIFASSGSIYGIKKEKRVTENLDLYPLTDYNKSKMICEKVLESFKDKIKIISIRPATVCGFSKRLRLDVVLNLFCYQAYFKKKIIVTGGKQIRPLIHIKDMVRCYEFFIKKNLVGVYNLGTENKTILNLARNVQKLIPCSLKIVKTNDPRSYRLDSTKLLRTGFKIKYNSDDAIKDLKFAFKKFKPSTKNWNLKWLEKKRII
tara:strand:- start:261 stop:1184 length:924 start_codon:yes stop_codon:yes gene_type:complete